MATEEEQKKFQDDLAAKFEKFYRDGYARGRADAERENRAIRANALTKELQDIMRPPT